MPASFLSFAPGLRALGLAVVLPASLVAFSPATLATDVLVITDSRHPVRTMGDELLIELDEAPRIEAELSAALPADPDQATAIARRRLNQGGADLQHRIASAYQSLTDAWSLGITSIPAVVVDRRYVVYGEPDVARAIARIEQHRRTQP
ncbi:MULTISPECIES: TIGR03757 family integrating conjugative element protein [Xanthomonas]|uniref:TIGR03757 family integrating conjugative element protein n=1 Tax=Xanthomonas TaxID=338 RepID=UPI000BAB0B30|nr:MULTISPECIES: TIGR03757 family integrating conjugative element protein [Xanthomonas]ASW45308.1 integrating conjugative element protein [Xanthomonas hortorum]MCE4282632.1 TIGR03757 family integrating conjugative element protein [Xanthomonas hortorum pv. vitians]MCE4338927.1 TIGR03757 family integrating conjugative element protein [Xanthomonas hortorum pv. vitians]MCE4508703.1 TIGR03757 family integrating conjugative element protein [Xanthomonas hortorum pv. vitians]WJM75917.1 TIGR03757 famil